jgi:hypothetical protein
MIVWIGSYPRSGNTLTRMLLRELFGVGTWSIYGDRHDIGANRELSKLVGHQSLEAMNPAALQRAQASDRIYFIKTHKLFPPAGKKIYVCRDARAAIVSEKYYGRGYYENPMTLWEYVMGHGFGGSWSSHVAEWTSLPDTNLLILRYEDLIAGEELSDAIVQQLESFLDMRHRGTPRLDFARLKLIEPRFFRVGSNQAGMEEIESTCPNLFWHFHGKIMQRRGYVDKIPNVDYVKLVQEISLGVRAIRDLAPVRPAGLVTVAGESASGTS